MRALYGFNGMGYGAVPGSLSCTPKHIMKKYFLDVQKYNTHIF